MKKTVSRSGDPTEVRIAVYIRVSSQKQARDGDSLEAQQNIITKYIESQKEINEWRKVTSQLFIEPGKSAKSMNRPTFQRMLREVRSRSFTHVIALKLDRVARSLRDFLEITDILKDHDTRLILLKENFDSGSPYQKILIYMVAAFAEMERDAIADRTLTTMIDRAERGLCNGAIPVGYETGEGGRLVVHATDAALVKVIFDAFERVGSAGRVVAELSRRGIVQPVRTTASGGTRGGRPFQKQQVLRILTNPAYVGTIVWGTARAENSHPAIIEAEHFARVQRRLEETRSRRSNFRRPSKRTYVLSGLLRCSCGNHMVGASYAGRSKKAYRYYTCTRQQHEGTRASCQAPRIPADDLEKAITHRLIEIGNRDEARQAIIASAASMVNGRRGELEATLANIRQRQLANRAERVKLVDVLKVGGAKAFASVKEELARLEQEADDLNSALAAATAEQQPLEEAEVAARAFLESWGGIGDIFAAAQPEELRQVLQHYVEVIEFRATEPGGHRGEYAIRLFPEVDSSFGPDDPPGGDDLGQGAKMKPAPRGGAGSTLTKIGSVCTNDQKAPRVGFEPTT